MHESELIEKGGLANRNAMQTQHEKLKGKRGWLHLNLVGPNREMRRKEDIVDESLTIRGTKIPVAT